MAAAWEAPLTLPCMCERCAVRLASCLPAAGKAQALSVSQAAEDVALRSRFLAGSSGDAAKAAHVLTDSLLWKHEFGVDRLLADGDASDKRLHTVQRYFPMGLLDGHDATGRPIVVNRIGFSDPTFATATNVFGDENGEEAWLRSHVLLNERAAQRGPERLVLIDLRSLSRVHVSRVALASMRRSVAIDQRHYPGSVHRVYVLNSPLLLRSVWAVITSWLDPISLDKVRVLGDTSDPAVAAELLEAVPAALLPDYCGGAARGCVPLHPALRAGAGHAPVDEEASATLAMGGAARATATLPADGARAVGLRLCARALFYSGVACEVALDAAWLGADGAALGAALPPGGRVAAAYAPSELPLHAPPDGAARLELRMHNEEGWKERTVLWQLDGLERDAWSVVVAG